MSQPQRLARRRASSVCQRVLEGAGAVLCLDSDRQDRSGVVSLSHAELHFHPGRTKIVVDRRLDRMRADGIIHYHADIGSEIHGLARDGAMETYTLYRRTEGDHAVVCWYQQVRVNRVTGQVAYRENEAWYVWDA